MPQTICDVLELPPLVVPVATLTIGWPDEQPEQPERLPLAAIRHDERYQPFDIDRIDHCYAGKEALPANQHFVEVNHKETLAQVFTDIRYTRRDNEAMSTTYLDMLRRQGFLTTESLRSLLTTNIQETRPTTLECDVVRFQNNKEKWVAVVGLLDNKPYEIFTGLMDDDEGIMLPKSVTKGQIIKCVNSDGSKRYDFHFQNHRGYKTTVEGLSEKFNPEYWNYAKLISGVLRYGMPLERVIHLVSSLSLDSENINSWTIGVARALRRYLPGQPSDDEV